MTVVFLNLALMALTTKYLEEGDDAEKQGHDQQPALTPPSPQVQPPLQQKKAGHSLELERLVCCCGGVETKETCSCCDNGSRFRSHGLGSVFCYFSPHLCCCLWHFSGFFQGDESSCGRETLRGLCQLTDGRHRDRDRCGC